MPLRPIPLVALVSLTLTACAQPSITVDETVTGIEVAFSYDSALALDQVEVSAWTEDRSAAFEPFLLPEEPILFEGTEQSFALLLAEELAGQTIRLELVGLSAGESVAAGQGNVTVALGAMTPVSIALSPEEVCDLDEDRDGICDTEDPCIDLDADGIGLAGTDLSGCLHPIEDSNDHDSTVCADTDGDSCDDCSLGGFDPSGDGPDGDGDGICDQGDACTDLDGDGFGTGTLNNADCLYEQNDIDDSLATRCLDSDQDSCDDCASGSFDPSDDGSDLDSDGLCDMGDTCTDIDDDGVGSDGLDRTGCDIQIADTNDYDATLCADTDADGCDDCVQGHYDPMNDGEDTDGDGICNRSDTCTDLDGDGLGDGTLNNEGCIVATLDAAPEDPFQCADTDADSCDDCLSGLYNTLQDGEDADEDGICDTSDLCTDLDRDGLGTGTGGNIGCLSLVNDSDDTQAFACADLDADGCDDCAAGSWNPDDDGLDDDSDGLCNAGDTCTDVDGDGIGNGTLGNTGCVRSGTDSNDLQDTICLDSDSDGCDDCSSGTFAPMSDGSDLDSDGICDFTDRCIDMDGDGFGDGSLGNETCPQSLTDVDDTSAQRCFDTDQDGCDDCSNGSFNPTSDGADGDNDGICDLSDRCTDLDGDGLGNGNLGNTECITTLTDINDNAPGQCYDSDGDTCDDCSQTNIWNPGQDGTDTDSDGVCDLGDSCTDYDGDGFGTGTLNNVGCAYPETDANDFLVTVCADTDSDLCDDCSSGSFDISSDGPDTDLDGLCDLGDTCTDLDGDGIGTGTQSNTGCAYPLTDSNDNDASQCGDTDFDSCDDCIEGYFMPFNDGVDLDADGICDAGDACIDIDQDGICTENDCDDQNPYCDVDCSDGDADGFCVNWDCNDSIWACTTDCSTNSDGDWEAVSMSDCMEVYCGSDPYDPSSSCAMPESAEELAEAIGTLDGGSIQIIVGSMEVEDTMPNLDDDGTITITQAPGTEIWSSANTLFRLTGSGHRLDGLVIRVEEGNTVIDVDGDENIVTGLSMITVGEQPREGIDISGADNLINDNYIAGFDDRGIVVDGNGADGNKIINNVITGGVDFTSNDKAGIFVRSAEDTLIVGNVVAHNNMDGIALQRAERTMIVHNTIDDNANGLVFAGWGSNRASSDTCARANLITGHSWGAGIVSRSGTSWDTSSGCSSASGYGNNTYDNGSACDFGTCFGCNCLPSDDWWEHNYAPNYVSVEREDAGFYCLESSPLEDLGRELGYDLNGDQPGHFNGNAPDIGAREGGSTQCQ